MALFVTTLSFICFTVVLGAWVVYPLALALVSCRPRSIWGDVEPLVAQTVSAIIATRDEPAVVSRRVEDLHNSPYPMGQLEIVVAVDAGAVYAPAEYMALVGAAVRVVEGDAPGGKAATLNAGVRASSSDILIFADSHQFFSANTLADLVASLGDPRFGAVTGRYRQTAEKDLSPIGLYWRFETLLRRVEARVHSVVGVAGAIYALRRPLWKPLPAHLILDDLYVALEVVQSGYRVGFCETALAMDSRNFTNTQEVNRKVRTLTGVIQLCAWRPDFLLPWRNPIWIQFVCHKLLRLATPFLLLIGFLGLIPLLFEWVRDYWLATTMLGLTTAGSLFWIAPSTTRRVAEHIAASMWLLATPFVAVVNAVRGRWDVWGQSKQRDSR